MKNKLIYIIGLYLIFSACERTNDSDETDILVLQAYLYQHEPVTEVSLSHTISFQSDDTIHQLLTGAEMYITWNSNDYYLVNDDDGYYYYPSDDLQILEDNTYSITATYKGTTLTSTTTVPAKPTGLTFSSKTLYFDESFSPMMPGSQDENEIEISWDNPDKEYFYVVIQNIEEDPESIELGFTPPDGGPNFRFLSQPFITDTYVIRTLMSLQQYGHHVVKVYKVNEEYAYLYENREQDSRSLSEPFTNINNGLGIFTAFSSMQDTINVLQE